MIKGCERVSAGQTAVVVIQMEPDLIEEKRPSIFADRKSYTMPVNVLGLDAATENRGFQEKRFAGLQVEFHGRCSHGKQGRKRKVRTEEGELIQGAIDKKLLVRIAEKLVMTEQLANLDS